MKGYKTNFNLLKDENVLVETAHIYDHRNSPFRIFSKLLVMAIIFGLLIGAFLLFAVASAFPNDILIPFILGGISLFIGVIALALSLKTGYFSFFRKRRTIFYITNQRIVELVKKGSLNRTDHFKEIKYNHLDYLIKNRKTLSFHKRIIFQFPFYALDDDVYKAEPVDQEKIVIHLGGARGRRVWEDIKAYLFPMIPLIAHPKLKFIIVNKNLAASNDNF